MEQSDVSENKAREAEKDGNIEREKVLSKQFMIMNVRADG